MSRTFRRTDRDDWADDLGLPWWAPDSVHRRLGADPSQLTDAARMRQRKSHKPA